MGGSREARAEEVVGRLRWGGLLPCGVRVVQFGREGTTGGCGGSDGTLALVDVQRGGVKAMKQNRRKSGATVGISAVQVLGEDGNLIAVGEDEGMVGVHLKEKWKSLVHSGQDDPPEARAQKFGRSCRF